MCPLCHLLDSWVGDKASLEEANLDKRRGKTEDARKQQPNNYWESHLVKITAH